MNGMDKKWSGLLRWKRKKKQSKVSAGKVADDVNAVSSNADHVSDDPPRVGDSKDIRAILARRLTENTAGFPDECKLLESLLLAQSILSHNDETVDTTGIVASERMDLSDSSSGYSGQNTKQEAKQQPRLGEKEGSEEQTCRPRLFFGPGIRRLRRREISGGCRDEESKLVESLQVTRSIPSHDENDGPTKFASALPGAAAVSRSSKERNSKQVMKQPCLLLGEKKSSKSCPPPDDPSSSLESMEVLLLEKVPIFSPEKDIRRLLMAEPCGTCAPRNSCGVGWLKRGDGGTSHLKPGSETVPHEERRAMEGLQNFMREGPKLCGTCDSQFGSGMRLLKGDNGARTGSRRCSETAPKEQLEVVEQIEVGPSCGSNRPIQVRDNCFRMSLERLFLIEEESPQEATMASSVNTNAAVRMREDSTSWRQGTRSVAQSRYQDLDSESSSHASKTPFAFRIPCLPVADFVAYDGTEKYSEPATCVVDTQDGCEPQDRDCFSKCAAADEVISTRDRVDERVPESVNLCDTAASAEDACSVGETHDCTGRRWEGLGIRRIWRRRRDTARKRTVTFADGVTGNEDEEQELVGCITPDVLACGSEGVSVSKPGGCGGPCRPGRGRGGAPRRSCKKHSYSDVLDSFVCGDDDAASITEVSSIRDGSTSCSSTDDGVYGTYEKMSMIRDMTHQPMYLYRESSAGTSASVKGHLAVFELSELVGDLPLAVSTVRKAARLYGPMA